MFHYIISENGGEDMEGWVQGRPDFLSSNQKKEWHDAVEAYWDKAGVDSPTKKLKKGVEIADAGYEEIRFFELGDKSIPIIYKGEVNLFDILGKAKGAVFTTPLDMLVQKIRDAVNAVVEKIANAFQIVEYIKNVKKQITEQINSLIDKVEELEDMLDAAAVKCNKIFVKMERMTSDPTMSDEEKQKLKDKINEEVAMLGEELCNAFKALTIVRTLTEIIEFIQQAEQCGESSGKKLLQKLDILKDLDLDTDKIKFKTFLSIIIPLLGAMIALAIANKKMQQKENEKFVADSGYPTAENAKCVVDDSAFSEIDEHKDSDDFPFTTYKNNGVDLSKLSKDSDVIVETDDNGNCNCKVSMCEDDEPIDMEDLFKALIDDEDKVLIEFDRLCNYSMVAKESGEYKVNDIIAYVDGLPLKSKWNMRVLEIGDYFMYCQTIDVEPIIEQYDAKKFDELKDVIVKYSDCTNFIKDYMMYTRIPAISAYTNPLRAQKSCDDLVDDYFDDCDDMLEDYNDEIEDACQKDVVKPYCESENLMGFKAMLDAKKDVYFKKFINQYNNYNKGTSACKGRIKDFMLIDLYIDFISDKFEYDDDNQFVKRLYAMLCEFVSERMTLELHPIAFNSLVNTFNKDCKKAFGNRFKNSTFYKEVSKYIVGKCGTNKIMDLTKVDEDNNSLFHIVKEYFEGLNNYQKDTPNMDFTEGMDVENILNNGGGSSKKRTNLEKDIQKMSLKFVLIKKIEEEKDNNTLKGIFNNFQMTRFNIISNLPSFDDYDGSIVGEADPLLIANVDVANDYRNALKNQCKREKRKLEDLCSEVIKWYSENSKKIDSGEIFDSLKEATCVSRGDIYYNNIKCERHFASIDKSGNRNKKGNGDDNDECGGNDNNKYHQLGLPEETTTSCEITSLEYWMKYMCMATLVNCMMPMYWSTGFIGPSGPVKLPIILIPFTVVNSGSIIIVIGLGLCGICPYPMILFVNTSTIKGSIIPPINLVVDLTRKGLKKLADTASKAMLDGLMIPVPLMEEEERKYKEDVEKIDMQIASLREMKIPGINKKRIREEAEKRASE